TLVSRKRLRWQRKQHAALLVERLPDGACAVLDPGTIDGRRSGPVQSLPVEIGEVGVAPSGEERLADVSDGALDSPLFVAASDGDRARLEAVVRRHLEQRWMEANRVAVALEDCAFQIVVEKNAGNAAEFGERLDVPAHEKRHRGTREEAEKQPARVAQ